MLLLAIKDKYNLGVGGKCNAEKVEGLWASTTFGQEEKMVKKFLGYDIESRGSSISLLDMDVNHIIKASEKASDNHKLILFVDSRWFKENKPKFRVAGSHFIFINNISDLGDGTYSVSYWDYGKNHDTHIMTKQQLEGSTFGRINIKRKENGKEKKKGN